MGIEKRKLKKSRAFKPHGTFRSMREGTHKIQSAKT